MFDGATSFNQPLFTLKIIRSIAVQLPFYGLVLWEDTNLGNRDRGTQMVVFRMDNQILTFDDNGFTIKQK
jgi:hypothetical protein